LRETLKIFCVSGKEISDKLQQCSFNQALENHILGNYLVYSDMEFCYHVPSEFSLPDRAWCLWAGLWPSHVYRHKLQV